MPRASACVKFIPCGSPVEFSYVGERRLFYVALTRARRSVAMFTTRGQCSFFLRELEQNGEVSITDADGQVIEEEECPSCRRGILVLRSGPYGEFHSCSNFPVCRYNPRKRGNALAPANTSGTTVSQTKRRVAEPPSRPFGCPAVGIPLGRRPDGPLSRTTTAAREWRGPCSASRWLRAWNNVVAQVSAILISRSIFASSDFAVIFDPGSRRFRTHAGSVATVIASAFCTSW